MGGLQADQQMHMIGNPADSLGESTESGNRATQVLMQPCSPLRVDQGFAILCSEHEMVMQAEKGGCHVAYLLVTMLSHIRMVGYPEGMPAMSFASRRDASH